MKKETYEEKRRRHRNDAMAAMLAIVDRVRRHPEKCRPEDILAAPEAARIILEYY